jgi:hypothetical protein
LTDPVSTRTVGPGDHVGRLGEVERRIDALAANPAPSGLTAADPDTGERWQATQVWAHLAEIVGYWQGQIEVVTTAFDGAPVPFGRTKYDPRRIAAVEAGRKRPITDLIERTRHSVTEVHGYLAGLAATDWHAVGRHETLGEMDVDAIVERFVTGHLEEHLDQLDGLVAGVEELGAGD